MFQRRQRHRRIVSQSIRRALGLENIRIRKRRAVDANHNRRINRRTHNSQLTTTILLILSNMPMRKSRRNSPFNQHPLRNVSRSRLLRSNLIRQLNIQLSSGDITSTRALLRPSRSLTINRIMSLHQQSIAARFSNSMLDRLQIHAPQRRRRFLLE